MHIGKEKRTSHKLPFRKNKMLLKLNKGEFQWKNSRNDHIHMEQIDEEKK
jgi:hypothetical protein